MMRIITGKAKGIRLKTLEGNATRPTSERVKEAVFSMIQMDIEGREVLDMFSGSGQMALEALSRGAIGAVMLDRSPDAIKIITENAQKTALWHKIDSEDSDTDETLDAPTPLFSSPSAEQKKEKAPIDNMQNGAKAQSPTPSPNAMLNLLSADRKSTR